ncbi:MAG: phosphate/phosphite/phosphonate ABC transporter substrate-binding protein [Chloroflexi bacterium]|nr:phosphate/phosphite/phosphonate ABC transporter substrate-binding protein [Chloroflexota bacterium]
MKIRRVSLIIGAMLAILVLFVVGCRGTSSSSEKAASSQKPKYYTPATLRVGLIPNIAPDKQRAKYEPFRAYLQKKLGMPVDLFVATNYTGVVQAMVSGKLDLAYFGGLTYAQALEQTPIEPIVTEVDRETGTTEYWSEIITRKDSGINSLADLKGKTFAFGDPSSTSGSLYPRLMLISAGYDWKNDFKPIRQVIYTGGHDATAGAVVNGRVDAGGLEGRILDQLEKNGKVDGSKLKVLDKRLVQGYPWCVPSNLDPAYRAKLIDAFENISDPSLLDLLRAKRYAPVSAMDYDYVRKEAKQVGLIKAR